MSEYVENTRIVKDINLAEGGLYDVLYLDLVDGFPDSKLVFSLVSTPESIATEGVSRRITGLQKLVQQFLRVLFTSRGSDVLRPNVGTSMPDIARYSNIGHRFELENMIRSEIASASIQVADITASLSSPYEILQEASLIDIDIGQVSISVGITVLSLAGDKASIFAPFPRFELPFNV